ncbi:MAG: DUF3737 family protein [Oscillospiraceae bacterium]|nr:DUF3737 family protein [Oscillospiraceae bacterium]
MNKITNTFFEGERPLYGSKDIELENVKIYPGESALKETKNIHATHCEFMGKYPFWHTDGALIEDCLFTVYARAAIWYSKGIIMRNSKVEAPKMFRELDGVTLDNVKLTVAEETLWNCRDIKLTNVEAVKGDYILMNGKNIEIDNLKLQGNYSFQDVHNAVVRNSILNSKDAFWHTENVTVYDSVLNGEYLGWYSKNLRLVNCTISGTQPLCYVENLIMENCVMTESADLAFEYTTLQATINSPVASIKNPLGGSIRAKSIGEVILDENCRNRGACEIIMEDEVAA